MFGGNNDMRNRELGLFNCIRHKSYTGMLVIANENKIGWHHDLVRPIDGAFLFGGNAEERF